MGSVVLIAIPIVILFLLGILASPFFFIPAAVFLLVAFAMSPFMVALRSGSREGGGVPNTEDAAYDPVQEPQTTPGR